MNPERSGIVIADDHQLVAEGIRNLLEPENHVLDCVSTGQELLDAVDRLHADVAIVDISMPGMNGLQVLRTLKQRSPEVKVILVTMHSDPSYLHEALRCGTDGYVLKHASASELGTAISDARRGRRYITATLAARTLAQLEHGGAHDDLTLRQVEVLQLVARGKAGKEIAHDLNITVKTVEFHKTRIMRKLRLHSTAELTRYAITTGLVV